VCEILSPGVYSGFTPRVNVVSRARHRVGATGREDDDVMELLQTLEQSRFAMFVKESGTAYTTCLAFHTIGLAFLVGISGGTALRVLGVARSLPLAPMEDFFPLMYAGFWINAATGAVLLSLYPTKYVVDPTMYIKLSAVALAMVALRLFRTHVFGDPASLETPAGAGKAKTLAVAMLLAWTIAIVAGRVTAYTAATKIQTAIAVVLFAAAALPVGYYLVRLWGRLEASVRCARRRRTVN
jgi:hypothetical protein